MFSKVAADQLVPTDDTSMGARSRYGLAGGMVSANGALQASPGAAQLPGAEAGIVTAAPGQNLERGTDLRERVGKVGHAEAPAGQVDAIVADLPLRLIRRERGEGDMLD